MDAKELARNAADAFCRICGEELGLASCLCSGCQSPYHADCFSYAGGCPSPDCESVAAVFGAAPPRGWHPHGEGPGNRVFRVPGAAAPAAAGVALPAEGTVQCLRYWTACSQLEFFSLVGQAWLTTFCAAMALTGLWELHVLLTIALALTALSHVSSLISLALLGWRLTGTPRHEQGESSAGMIRDAAASRLGSMLRSRSVLTIAAVVLAPGLPLGIASEPGFAVIVAVCAVLFPWFSLVPRWRIEEPMLREIAEPESLPAGGDTAQATRAGSRS